MKDDIRDHLKSAERNLLIDLPKQISDSLEISNTSKLHTYVDDWLNSDRSDALIDYLRMAIYQKKIDKLSRFGNNLKELGIDLNKDGDNKLDESDSGCKWVPSSFSKLDGKRVFGGVLLQPKLSLQDDKGFKGFGATAKNAGFSAKSSNGNGSGRGSSPKPPKKKQPSNDSKTKTEILEKYGHGKGWPDLPIRIKDTKKYFGKPGTCKTF